MGLVDNLRKKLAKTKSSFVSKVAEAVSLTSKVDEDLMEELEDILIQADIGVEVSTFIIDQLREKIRVERIKDPQKVVVSLQQIIGKMLREDYAEEDLFSIKKGSVPYVILFIGVNGVGKTTTIGKLAKQLTANGLSVMLIAGDTFRAAAIEQLTIWAERSGSLLQKQQSGSDPSAVIFDGLVAAINKKIDVVLIDTAGRLHNKTNLMKELFKMRRSIKKVIPAAPQQTLLVVDASTGQNAISQAILFNEITEVSGLVLTKLDGTAKGGIIIGIKHQMNVPVKLIGVGESVEDLRKFDAEEFVSALFE
jgi:fused signal recognition particle receptor